VNSKKDGALKEMHHQLDLQNKKLFVGHTGFNLKHHGRDQNLLDHLLRKT
jgi:hypothetical protein